MSFAHSAITAPAGARAQQLDGVFATVAELLAQLVNHARAALVFSGNHSGTLVIGAKRITLAR
jgi:hypothetical protein